MAFDIGQKVICVKRNPWLYARAGGPAYLSENTVTAIHKRGEITVSINGIVGPNPGDAVSASGMAGGPVGR